MPVTERIGTLGQSQVISDKSVGTSLGQVPEFLLTGATSAGTILQVKVVDDGTGLGKVVATLE